MNNILKRSSKLRLAFLGDSITVGDGDTQARGWPSRLCEASSPIPTKMHCYNLGVGGDRVSQLAGRAQHELKARLTGRTGRGVVVMIGVNDALRAAAKKNKIPIEPEEMKADFIEILTQAKEYGAVIIVESTPVLPEFAHVDGMVGTVVMQKLEHINQVLASVCESEKVPLIKLTNLLKHDAKFMKALHDGDGLHPNDLGYDRVTNHIQESPEWVAFLHSALHDV